PEAQITAGPPAPPAAAPPANGAYTATPPAPAAKPQPAPGLLARLRELVWPASEPTLHQTESFRQGLETVVFVVLLVLLLKPSAAEAFVIPTGSMATTLWGYQRVVTCPKCGYVFPVNASHEVEAPADSPRPVRDCVCPNCRYHIDFHD